MYRLSSIASVFSGYTFRETLKSDKGGTLRVIQPKNLNNLSDSLMIPVFPHYQRYLLQKHDILVTIKGAINNVKLLILNEDEQYVCNAAFAVIRPDQSQVYPPYLSWYLQHEDTQHRIRSVHTGTTVPNLSIKDLQNLTIPVISMQKQFAIGKLALLELERTQHFQELLAKRKSLLDINLINITKEGKDDA